jgi:hypothetical protein
VDGRAARAVNPDQGGNPFDLIRQRAAEEARRQEQAAAEAKARRHEQVRQEMAEIEREIKKKGAVVEENEALWFYNNIRIKAKGDAAYREKMRLKKKENGNV